ncbi:MAG: hypothetical protein ACLPV4_04440 [Solirubrobacteraceae bacterium]
MSVASSTARLEPASSISALQVARRISVSQPAPEHTSSNDAQNDAFEAASFPGSSYSGVTNYDFAYHTASSGNWVDSNTPDNNQGNISG